MHSRRPIQKYKFPARLSKSRKSKRPAASKNVVSKIRKLAAKPTGGKNWCDLPYEMKLECMKWMDLATKFRMRRTGRNEKEIFDTLKFSIDGVRIDIADKIKLNIDDADETWTLTTSAVVPVDTVVKCAAFLLKSAENIDGFFYTRELDDDSSVDTRQGQAALLRELERCDSFRLSRFTFWSQSNIDVPLCVLRKCSVPLESVSALRFGFQSFDLGPLLAVPQFTTAKNISYENRLSNEEFVQFYSEIAQKWIETDAPIGNVAETGGFAFDLVNERLAERFADRLVLHNSKGVRVRTDDPEKHVIYFIARETTWLEVIDASDPDWSDGEDSEDEDGDIGDDGEIYLPILLDFLMQHDNNPGLL